MNIRDRLRKLEAVAGIKTNTLPTLREVIPPDATPHEIARIYHRIMQTGSSAPTPDKPVALSRMEIERVYLSIMA